jgi:hypothetical protein
VSGRSLAQITALTAFVALAACGTDAASLPLTSPISSGAPDAGSSTDVNGSPGRGDGSAGGAAVDTASDVGGRADGSPVADTGIESGAIVDAVNQVDGGPPLRCNGHEILCDRRFDEVVFPATHNAMSNADEPWFAPNQEHGIARQLQDGIRALLLDTYVWKGGLYLCHGLCEVGNRPLVDGLRDIAGFLRGNPHEVVALLIEDHVSPAETERAFADSGLLASTYVHRAGTVWPTLRALIDSGRRVLVTAENQRSTLPWYHHLWDVASDTPYAFKNAQEFSCRANRGMIGNDLFLLNHWLENPLASSLLSRTANARTLLLERAQACQRERGKLPNFVAVNHYATGDLFAVVRQLNGLSP